MLANVCISCGFMSFKNEPRPRSLSIDRVQREVSKENY